jgi:hypothetical protein
MGLESGLRTDGSRAMAGREDSVRKLALARLRLG